MGHRFASAGMLRALILCRIGLHATMAAPLWALCDGHSAWSIGVRMGACAARLGLPLGSVQPDHVRAPPADAQRPLRRGHRPALGGHERVERVEHVEHVEHGDASSTATRRCGNAAMRQCGNAPTRRVFGANGAAVGAAALFWLAVGAVASGSWVGRRLPAGTA